MQLALPSWPRLFKPSNDTARTGPQRRRARGHVFIHDAVTPWAGETLLLSILRQQALAEDDED